MPWIALSTYDWFQGLLFKQSSFIHFIFTARDSNISRKIPNLGKIRALNQLCGSCKFQRAHILKNVSGNFFIYRDLDFGLSDPLTEKWLWNENPSVKRFCLGRTWLRLLLPDYRDAYYSMLQNDSRVETRNPTLVHENSSDFLWKIILMRLSEKWISCNWMQSATCEGLGRVFLVACFFHISDLFVARSSF